MTNHAAVSAAGSPARVEKTRPARCNQIRKYPKKKRHFEQRVCIVDETENPQLLPYGRGRNGTTCHALNVSTASSLLTEQAPETNQSKHDSPYTKWDLCMFPIFVTRDRGRGTGRHRRHRLRDSPGVGGGGAEYGKPSGSPDPIGFDCRRVRPGGPADGMNRLGDGHSQHPAGGRRHVAQRYVQNSDDCPLTQARKATLCTKWY